jgi:hypothetical protein
VDEPFVAGWWRTSAEVGAERAVDDAIGAQIPDGRLR